MGSAVSQASEHVGSEGVRVLTKPVLKKEWAAGHLPRHCKTRFKAGCGV